MQGGADSAPPMPMGSPWNAEFPLTMGISWAGAIQEIAPPWSRLMLPPFPSSAGYGDWAGVCQWTRNAGAHLRSSSRCLESNPGTPTARNPGFTFCPPVLKLPA